MSGPPSFVFRKLLHIVAFTSVSLMFLTAGRWQDGARAELSVDVDTAFEICCDICDIRELLPLQ